MQTGGGGKGSSKAHSCSVKIISTVSIMFEPDFATFPYFTQLCSDSFWIRTAKILLGKDFVFYLLWLAFLHTVGFAIERFIS